MSSGTFFLENGKPKVYASVARAEMLYHSERSAMHDSGESFVYLRREGHRPLTKVRPKGSGNLSELTHTA